MVIKNLEKDQLIERYRDQSDSRVCMIRLTDTGESLIKSIFPEHLQQLDNTLDNLNREEKQNLIQILKKLNGIG